MASLWMWCLTLLVSYSCYTHSADVSTEELCPLPELAHSYIDSVNASVAPHTVIELHCEEGYRLPYSKTTVWHLVALPGCLWADRKGDLEFQTCQKVGSCWRLSVHHAHVLEKAGGYMPYEIAPLLCDEGFEMTDMSAYVMCQQDGSFKRSSVASLCKLTACYPPHLQPATRVVSPFPHRGMIPVGQMLEFVCEAGLYLVPASSAVSVCRAGSWQPAPPQCVPENALGDCVPLDTVPFALEHLEGVTVRYTCPPGFRLEGEAERVCEEGQWSGMAPRCDPSTCPSPPTLPHAVYNVFSGRGMDEGSRIYYFCHHGYRMVSNVTVLVCRAGQWQGRQALCVKRRTCDTPMDISNGNWSILLLVPSFQIGQKIMYRCEDGYKLVGASMLQCLTTGYWSDYTPQCRPQDLYCSEPSPVQNGYYMCKPSHCAQFKVNTELHYVCNTRYAVRPGDGILVRCVTGGQWSGHSPICLSAVSSSSPTHLNPGTMTIVVATSCSVLGLLLVIMLVVTLQRRMKASMRPTVTPPAPPPPPYCQLVPEHDRVALIAFADSPPLPSYEEAVRGGRRRPGAPDQRFIGPDTRPGASDQHRASVSTATSARDNLSLPYSSIDTMNVSDGTSTCITIDTYDSGASNPSLAVSQRAQAGSIASSSDSLTNEEAPLLEQYEPPPEGTRSNAGRDPTTFSTPEVKDT